MSVVLRGDNWNKCVIYLDDVLIFSETFEQHVRDVDSILGKIEAAGLKLSPQKCRFFTNEVKFLGHIVSENGTLY